MIVHFVVVLPFHYIILCKNEPNKKYEQNFSLKKAHKAINLFLYSFMCL